jgi:hypothetical protein
MYPPPHVKSEDSSCVKSPPHMTHMYPPPHVKSEDSSCVKSLYRGMEIQVTFTCILLLI